MELHYCFFFNLSERKMFSRAYKRLIKKEGKELSLPGLQYNPRQLFWISSAALYCKVARDNQMINTILTDNHAPYRYFYTYNFLFRAGHVPF